MLPSIMSSNIPIKAAYSQEEMTAIIATAQKLKRAGANEHSDPEFARLISILRIYSVQSQQQSQEKSAVSNQPKTAESTQPSFLPEQLDALRYQIQMYKLLSTNKPIPDSLQKTVLKSDDGAAVGGPPRSTAPPMAQTIVNAALKQELNSQTTASGPPTTASQESATFVSPYTVYAERTSLADMHQRLLFPSGLPSPIDHVTLKLQRDKFLHARVDFRIHELESLPSTLSNEHDEIKLRALIELKSLRLIEKQRQLRNEIAQSLSTATTLTTAIDRSSFRRMKKQSLREARQTEKQERAQRFERDKRERQKHFDFLNSILAHGRDFLLFHKQQVAKQNKLGTLVLRFHNNSAKEEERRLQRVSQERLNALKSNDEAAYLKLIDKTKDTRITLLLEQTNSFLTSLTNAVEKQKGNVGADFDIPIQPDLGTHEAEADPDGTRDYYATAHKIREEVTEQPSILIGGTLKDYQIKGLQWMVSLYNNRLNGILADEMGLGKTIQTLSLITYLIERKKQPGPFLVIVPLSTMTNWVIEFERWAPAVIKVVYKGSPIERKNLASVVRAGGFNVLLTTFEYIINPKDRPVLSKVKWVHMIIDEGHRMKNAESRLSTTLAQYYSARYRLILTGTPLQNNLPELWALLNFILPKVFNSVKSFDEWFNSPFSGTTGQDRIDLNEEEQLLIIRRLHKVLRPFLLRRLKKDVESELPDKVETIVKCPMSALQLRLYEQIRHRRFGGDGFSKKKVLNNLIMQFRKICNHPFVFDQVEELINPSKGTNDTLFRVAGKFELLDRILPKFKVSGHRILMFFQMTQVMDIMEDYLRWRGHIYLRLDGHTKPEERTVMLKTFNRPDDPPFIFLLSTRAGGLGLNLQTADTVIIYDSDWNPHQDLQAQDRAHRIGQKKEVRILRLITSKSVEETILARAQYKLDIDGKVIQAGKFDNKTSEREREELLRSLFGADGDDGEEGDKDGENIEKEGEIEDSDLNEIIARNEGELELFNKMDVERRQQEEQAWRARGNTGPVPCRLMQDAELPQEFLEDPELPEDGKNSAELYFGRGGRQRKDVIYDDGLNEEQWLNAVDHGDLESVTLKKRRRREAKLARMAANNNDSTPGSEAGDTPGADIDNMDDEVTTPVHMADSLELPDSAHESRLSTSGHAYNGKKRGRKPKHSGLNMLDDFDASSTGMGSGSVVDDNSVDGQGGARGKKRFKKLHNKFGKDGADSGRRGHRYFADVDPDAPDTVDPAMRSALRRIFMAAYKAVEEAEVEIEGYTRRRCELYVTLPDRVSYADYYKYISAPIAMDMILHRAKHTFYPDLQSFISDFHLMFANAMAYNMEGSEVWEDAVQMKKVFDDVILQMCPNGNVEILAFDYKNSAAVAEPSMPLDHDNGYAAQQNNDMYKYDGYEPNHTDPQALQSTPQFTPRIKMKLSNIVNDDDDDVDQ
ncbi:hypothetical protein BDV3_003709 [Batrachochytrium dendrobatidis]|uniref:Uncharacterized protein n=1 Tax=Batrachochytrium dendrobatidis (strain JEL423) TaxID=403673 RepID=A0A177WDM2_BATDL|nr:ATP-dependent DNA helicase Snf21 [Batrachochytrium dendrobatidis]KAK5669613.1 ATP-dependent DNA helicase Snf21 [Batrachochytrium dendrobatidis]OAJ38143.1 hypothetical protein BDEG_22096 [Batrachochytrium dendrobatidis JEL423]